MAMSSAVNVAATIPAGPLKLKWNLSLYAVIPAPSVKFLPGGKFAAEKDTPKGPSLNENGCSASLNSVIPPGK